jgi:hypothetical protein
MNSFRCKLEELLCKLFIKGEVTVTLHGHYEQKKEQQETYNRLNGSYREKDAVKRAGSCFVRRSTTLLEREIARGETVSRNSSAWELFSVELKLFLKLWELFSEIVELLADAPPHGFYLFS